MATLTYVFHDDLYEDVEPSEKDPVLWEKAHESGLAVEEVPDLYPGVAGELNISGDPEALRRLMDTAARENLPGAPTTIQFDEHEMERVSRNFDDAKVVFVLCK